MSKPSQAEQNAIKTADELTKAGHVLLEKARAVVAARAEVDAEVRAIPGCSPRHDGALPSHEWESAIHLFEKVVRLHPSVTPPVARHSGRLARQAQDTEEQRTRLKRLRRRTPDQQRELDQLNAGRVVPPPVSTYTQ